MGTVVERPATSFTSGRRRGRRRYRWPVWSAVAVVVTLAVVYTGAGWYVSGQIIDSLRVPIADGPYDTEIRSIGDGQVELVPPDDVDAAADVDAVMGLRWDTGYAQVGPAISADGGTQVRPFTLLQGEEPPTGPDVAEFDGYAFPPDPSAVEVPVSTVAYPSAIGDLEAWYLPGEGSTWIVAVHGRGADRHELLRMVDAIGHLGYPTLIVRYRNDPGAPVSRDGIMLAGQDEWRDIEAAVDHAIAGGASDVVLYGASMGGAISLSYAMNEPREVVRGLVLESPLADLREVVRLRSGEALPVGGPVGDSLLAAGRLFTWLRIGLDFDTVDYVDRAGELEVPILLFHGTDDTSVPFAVGASLARARPDLVAFHPVEDAVHVRAWNEDPDAYAAVLGGFLEEIGRD